MLLSVSLKATGFFSLIKIVKFRNCDVIIKVVNNMVEKENNDIRQHNHESMSNCEISVMSKIEDLKCKICSDANVRMTYVSIYRDLLKPFRQLELAQYWKEWDNIKASLYYHRRKHAPALPKTVMDIKIKDDYENTSSGETFLR
jgi:hypothetical protein